MKKYVLILAVAMCLSLTGCETTTVIDPNTGETAKVVFLDSEKADDVEVIAESGVGILNLLAVIFPGLIGVGGIAGGSLATWRKMRPKLEQATRDRNIGFTAGRAMAEAFEMLKEKHPAVWDDIKPKIQAATDTASEVENAIRGFRGVEPKPRA